MRYYDERVQASRNFAIKVWNASRFIMMNLGDEAPAEPAAEELQTADRWILSKVNRLAAEVTENLDKYELGIALQKVYDFIWEEFCDWYIEMVKPRLWDKEDRTRNAALWTLKKVLSESLKLLHPFMPFVTEEIYCNLNEDEESIMISPWPVLEKNYEFPDEETEVEEVKEAVRAIRAVRTSMNVAPGRKAAVYVVSESERIRKNFLHSENFFSMLARASEVHVQSDKAGIADDAVSAVIPGANLYIPFSDLVEIDKELERLGKEENRLEGEIRRSNGMLKNEKFLAKAPAAKVEEEKKKLEKYEQMMAQVKEQIAHLKK